MTRTTHCMFALALVTASVTANARAQDVKALQDSFKQRYPQLVAAKQAGKVGETAAGYVEAVKGDADVAGLVSAENGDRGKLYGLLAKQEGISPEEVGRRNGVRNFAKAAPGEWLKGADGKWAQKR